jgi:hypothetical protein
MVELVRAGRTASELSREFGRASSVARVGPSVDGSRKLNAMLVAAMVA